MRRYTKFFQNLYEKLQKMVVNNIPEDIKKN